MERRSIGERLAALPLRHKVVPVVLALAVAGIFVGLAFLARPAYYRSVVVSYNAPLTQKLDGTSSDSAASSAVHLARTILSDDVLANLTAPHRASSWIVKAGNSASLRSHLKISALPGSRLRFVWVDEYPAETTAVTEGLARRLVSWLPSQSMLPTQSAIEQALPDSRNSELTPQPDATALHSAEDEQNARLAREQFLLQVTIEVLDVKLEGLQNELTLIGDNQQATRYSKHRSNKDHSAATSDSPSTASQTLASRVAVRNSKRPLGRGHVNSTSLVSKSPSRVDEQARRSQMLKQISSIRSQRMLIAKRLKEAQLEWTAAHTKAVHAKPPERVAAPASLPAGLSLPAAISLKSYAGGEQPQSLFSLAEPLSEVRESYTTRYLVGSLGILGGFILGLIYMAMAVRRFRPVDDATTLRALLPEGVFFVGSITETDL